MPFMKGICVTVYKKGAMEVKRRLETASNLAPEEEWMVWV